MAEAVARTGEVALVVPALNEALRIREVVEQALRHCPWVIVVDDGSDDGTGDRLHGLPVTVLRHPRRLGKGAALRTGFAVLMVLVAGYVGWQSLTGLSAPDTALSPSRACAPATAAPAPCPAPSARG